MKDSEHSKGNKDHFFQKVEILLKRFWLIAPTLLTISLMLSIAT